MNWTVERDANDYSVIEGNRRVAGYIVERKAARIIAAAPDLLDALKACQRHMTHSATCARDIERANWSCSCGFNAAYDAASVAIMKAEARGGQ